MKEKIGVVDVGGGLRGAYAAGVLDYCLDNNIIFDLGIGVSAGSANLVSYAAGQVRRNLQYYTEYALRKEYMSLGNFIKTGSYIDLDYVYSVLSNSGGEYPLDYPALKESKTELLVVAAEAENGNVKYFSKEDIHQDGYDIFKASSAIPFVCKPYPVEGVFYYDGAIGDPVPIEKAFAEGCDKVVLLLTLPEDELRSPKRDIKLAKRIRKKYPLAAKALEQRAENYNLSVKAAKKYQKEGKLFIVAPDDTCGVKTLSRNRDNIRSLYEKGYRDGAKIKDFLQ